MFFFFQFSFSNFFFFFFNDTATTEIYTLSLHDALPIYLTGVRPYSRPVSGPAPQHPTPHPNPVVRALQWSIRPLLRMWESHDPLDAYALVHMTSAGGDALVAIALADSVFFSIPIGQAKVKVALYLALTMAPLAVASPLVVPFLDRGGFRRVLSFCAALGRAAAAMYMAAKVDTVLLFPSAFVLLVLSKIHAIAKNGLTMAYAPSHRGLVEANARLGRIAVVGTAMVAGPGLIFIKLGGAPAVLYLAAAVYAVSALFNLRLPQPKGFGVDHTAVEKLG